MKRFLCVWNTKAFLTEKTKEYKGIDFFTDTNGYSEKDTEEINNLEIGQVYNVEYFENEHCVIRLQDKNIDKLEKEQISILHELCFDEMMRMSQLLNNEYIDKTQVKTRMNKLQELLDILTIE